MKKNKFNPELLKKEINRFRLLETYDFYHDEKKGPEFKLDEEDEEPNNDSDLNSDTQEPDAQAPEADISNAESDIENDLGLSNDKEIGNMPEPSPEVEEVPVEEPVDDGIEIDVTSLVKASEDAKGSADRAVKNTEIMLQKLFDIEQKFLNISNITTANSEKIDNIEHQIIKRIPTPVEKLEMRSFDSYPYNQKLTDFWDEKEGVEEKTQKEYVLTKDDVDNSYSELEIKNSFDDYEEEEIY